jgi:type IV pilus assembly protein PilY1
MKKNLLLMGLWLVLAFVSGFETADAVEPQLADYTSYPVFMANSVEPNILIMLDNSGSMNEQAYTDEFGGSVSDCGTATARLLASTDDAEERLDDDSVRTDTTNLYLGEGEEEICTRWRRGRCRTWVTEYFDTMVGLRFRNVEVPPDAVITNAYITFRAYTNGSGDPSFTIRAEDVGNAAAFSTGDNNLTHRTPTEASVAWNITDNWATGGTYNTPDLSTIVKEIVDRDDWSSGNAMAFGIIGTGTRSVRSWNYGDHNSGPVLVIEYDEVCEDDDSVRYYGYFDPDARYSYSSGFVRDPSGAWDGNWLNWVSMRKIDVARKVLMGGLATARTGGGNQTLYGEDPSGRAFVKRFNGHDVSPYNGLYYFGMADGYIYVDTDDYPYSGYLARYEIKVAKDVNFEPQDFIDGNLSGVLQRVGDKAYWGNTWFNTGTGSNESGGFIAAPIGTNMTSLITDLQNTSANTWTPLGESFYVATQYFKQQAVAEDLDYPNSPTGPFNDENDPYYQDQEVWCAKSFVIMLTDGASTKDGNIPSDLRDLADGHEAFLSTTDDGVNCNESTGVGCEFPSGGTDYLKDVAHYARTTDLRPTIEGEQNILLYTVYAFGDDPNARNLLKEAARQGGFEDRNGDGWPNGTAADVPNDRKEWDDDGDGVPDTYYEASDGYALEAQLISAINDILARAASGTAASVLATNAEGEGNLVQAYFRPSKIEGTEEVNWLGYLQSLWVDPCGNLREDSNQDKRLNLNEDLNGNGLLDGGEDVNGNGVLDRPATEDKIVTYYSDATTSDTLIYRYTSHYLYNNPLDCDGEGDPGDYVYEALGLEDISPIWEVGKVLADRDPDTRRIFTFIDTNNDQVMDEDPYGSFDSDGEVIAFNATNAAAIKPYLGVMDSGATGAWDYLGATHDNRVNGLISYIRGTDLLGARSRTINGQVWKLGDIVNSTPVTVAAPADNYHIIYEDQSYQDFLRANRDRETAIYVGANDGMLHAFTSWRYNSDTGSYSQPSGRETIGEELWAYIPQSLLPHLKWLPDPDYTHVYYVDFKPKVFDARIGDPLVAGGDPTWRTLLICGFNMGGKNIWAEGDFNDGNGLTTRQFYPAYVCIDITDPINPKVMWERSYTELGMTRGTPAVIRIANGEKDTDYEFPMGDWYAVFGSGPTDYDGSSSQNGYIFVVDLKTGDPAFPSGASDWQFDTGVANTYMNSPASLDKNLTNSVDAIYLGDTAGNLYHVSTLEPQAFDGEGEPLKRYPSDLPSDWTNTIIFNGIQPITAAVSLSVDALDDVWVYFGSGRYLTDTDKSNDEQQYMFGIRDPLFNESPSALPLGFGNLFDADPYTIYTNRNVDSTGGLARIYDWYSLLNVVRNTEDQDSYPDYFDGWYRRLEDTDPSERVITKPAILGGAVFLPAFTPSQDVCGFGGDSNFYAVYYETGTAFFRPLLPNGLIDVAGEDYKAVKVKVPLGEGMPPPAVGIHAGREKGARAFLQMSTGEVVEVEIETPFNIKSGLTTWRTN